MANKSPSVALVISNEYGNIPQIKLNGCYNDADNFINTIKKINPNTRFIIMRDNLPQSSPLFPSKKNIITQLNLFCVAPETVSFLYYSGHGASVNDVNKDESDTMVNMSNARIQRKSNDSTNGQFRDSCLVTNEGRTYGFLIDDEINNCFKNIPSNKRVYVFFDSCNSGTVIDLYSMFFVDPKNTKKFSSKTIPELLKEMKKPENNTNILSAYYTKKSNDIKGIVILISGTRDNTFSYEGNNLGQISGNFTTRLCWLLNNGIGQMSIGDFYLALVGILNNPEQLPVLTCSKFISLTKTSMADFNNQKVINNLPIPFQMGTVASKNVNTIKPSDYESDTDYDTSDDEVLVIDQVNSKISTPVTETDNEIKEQLAKAEEQAKKLAEEQAKKEAEEKAKKAADEKAKKAAEEKAKKEADAQAKKLADEKAKKEAEEQAKKEADEKAKKAAEEQAKKEADEKAKKEADEQAKKATEEQAKKATEEQAKKAAEEQAKKATEEQAKKAAEEQAKKEAEEQAKKAAEEKAKKAAEEKAKKAADEKAKKAADEQAKKLADEKAKKEAEEKAKKEAEEQAKQAAEEQANQAAEEQANQADMPILNSVQNIGININTYKMARHQALNLKANETYVQNETTPEIKPIISQSTSNTVLLKISQIKKQYNSSASSSNTTVQNTPDETLESNITTKNVMYGAHYINYLKNKK